MRDKLAIIAIAAALCSASGSACAMSTADQSATCQVIDGGKLPANSGGVQALCEAVTRELSELLVDYGLEVSSPGPERPLVKPDHFRRFLGSRAHSRTREPRDGHRSFTGELVGASDAEVTVAATTGVVTIPYAEIVRSHLVAGAEGDRTDDTGMEATR